MKRIIKLSYNELHNIIKEEIGRCNITESSLNRILQHMGEHDCAFISASRQKLKSLSSPDRTYMKNGYDESGKQEIGQAYSSKENRIRNGKLKDILSQVYGYGVTKVRGVYPERTGGTSYESGEDSFCVVNLKDDPNFFKNVKELSEYFNQDSFLYKPKGKAAYLVGTNHAHFPGYGQRGEDSDLHLGQSNFMTRIGNAAISFSPKGTTVNRDYDDAMDDIANGKGTYQHIWPDTPPTSFYKRKQMRINAAQKKNESLSRVYKLVRECIRDVLNEGGMFTSDFNGKRYMYFDDNWRADNDAAKYKAESPYERDLFLFKAKMWRVNGISSDMTEKIEFDPEFDPSLPENKIKLEGKYNLVNTKTGVIKFRNWFDDIEELSKNVYKLRLKGKENIFANGQLVFKQWHNHVEIGANGKYQKWDRDIRSMPDEYNHAKSAIQEFPDVKWPYFSKIVRDAEEERNKRINQDKEIRKGIQDYLGSNDKKDRVPFWKGALKK